MSATTPEGDPTGRSGSPLVYGLYFVVGAAAGFGIGLAIDNPSLGVAIGMLGAGVLLAVVSLVRAAKLSKNADQQRTDDGGHE